MDEHTRRAGPDGEDANARVGALEEVLRKVQSRLDALERSNLDIQSDMRTMKDQINSMQSSIQEMLMIFRDLSAKVRRQAHNEDGDD